MNSPEQQDSANAQLDDALEERIVPLRLQKFLARAGVASRRKSEDLMTAGRVKVNGEVVYELGSKVDPLIDTVTVDDIEVHWGDSAVTLMLHKPAGVITTMKDQVNRSCVADLVPLATYPGLYPIGRLDADTTGLLLFSTDGDLGNGLLHPRHHVLKKYLACVEGTPTDKQLEALRCGIELDDGPTQPAEVRIVRGEEAVVARKLMAMPKDVVTGGQRVYEEILKERRNARSIVEIGIREGRYHQVKNMLRAVGHPVVALHRSTFGPLELGELPCGSWRMLADSEVAALRNAIE